MLLRITGTVLLVLWLPFVAVAQEKTVEELDKEVQDLRSQLEKIAGDVSTLTDKTEENAKQLGELINLVSEQTIAQKNMLGAQGLNSNMQSEEFRQEMKRAVHESLQEEGTVIIRNKMATDQRVTVNREEHLIRAGGSLTLAVPVGTLTAQLPGQPLTTWTITAPKYEQKIDIVPSETVTAYRPVDGSSVTALKPIESITTYRPVYTPAPVYVNPVIETYYVDPYTTYYWYEWPY